MKETPLYQQHVNLGGKIVEFVGWALPIQYSGLLEEHDHVRNYAGLFDVSHMGEIIVEGPNAEKFIQYLLTNDISNMKDGKVTYSPMCYPDGGTVDDVLIYKLSSEKYLFVVNASNTEKDYKWMMENSIENVNITNVSNEYAQIAIQGPKAIKILKSLTPFPLEDIKPFRFQEKVEIAGVKSLISRTGYTGEDGFEIYISPKDAAILWDCILETGKDDKILPAGLGARDTLRFESGLPLYGQELAANISPIEAGLKRFVKLNKGDFIGRDVLELQINAETGRQLIGFEMIERGIPRHEYQVNYNGKNIGWVTSGSFSPTLKKNIGMALIDKKYASINEEIQVVIRNKAIKAKIIKLPFYTRKRG